MFDLVNVEVIGSEKRIGQSNTQTNKPINTRTQKDYSRRATITNQGRQKDYSRHATIIIAHILVTISALIDALPVT